MSSGGYVDELGRRVHCWNWEAILPQSIEMKLDCVMNQTRDLIASGCSGDTSREIRNVGAKTGV